MRYFIFSILISFLVAPRAYSQTVRVALEPVSAELGETVTVQVQASEGAAAGNVAYAIRYNPTALTLQGVGAITDLQATSLLATNPNQFPDGSGTLHIEHVFATGLPATTPIATLTFAVRDTTDLTLQFDNLTAYATDGTGLAIVGEDGGIGIIPTATEETSLPEQFTLHPNYPNPFNPTTTLAYDLPTPMQVRFEVFDVLGRRVSVLVDANQTTGRHQLQWDASRMASGVYFARLVAQSTQTGRQHIQTQKMLLVK